MWIDVTADFSKDERRYKDMYLEIDEVYDNTVEVSLFSRAEGDYEIFFTFDILHGVVYTDKIHAHAKREEMKRELEDEYKKHKEPTSDFINAFCEKHEVALPADIFFDFDAEEYL